MTSNININYKTNLPYLFQTKYGSGNAGIDLLADFSLNETTDIKPGEFVTIGTGLSIELPTGMMAMVVGRSGLAAKQGIIVPNSPGIIDSDYRGEIQVILHNISKKTRFVNRLDRIAQLLVFFVATPLVKWNLVNELNETARGANGLGSTGIN